MLSLSPNHQKREREPHSAKRLPRSKATGVRTQWAGPQLAHCFPVSDQRQRSSVCNHRPWDISHQLHMTLRCIKQAPEQKNSHHLASLNTPTPDHNGPLFRRSQPEACSEEHTLTVLLCQTVLHRWCVAEHPGDSNLPCEFRLKPQGPRYSDSFGPRAADGRSPVYSLSLSRSLPHKLIQRCILSLILSPPNSCWKHFSSSSISTSWSQAPTHLQTHLHGNAYFSAQTHFVHKHVCAHAHWIFNLCPIFPAFWSSATTAAFPKRQVFHSLAQWS